MDAQSRAYRDARNEDLTFDPQLSMMIDDGELTIPTGDPLPPEAYEAAEWDAGREGPKTIEQAKRALARRVKDNHAPDTDGAAYDDLSD